MKFGLGLELGHQAQFCDGDRFWAYLCWFFLVLGLPMKALVLSLSWSPSLLREGPICSLCQSLSWPKSMMSEPIQLLHILTSFKSLILINYQLIHALSFYLFYFIFYLHQFSQLKLKDKLLIVFLFRNLYYLISLS